MYNRKLVIYCPKINNIFNNSKVLEGKFTHNQINRYKKDLTGFEKLFNKGFTSGEALIEHRLKLIVSSFRLVSLQVKLRRSGNK